MSEATSDPPVVPATTHLAERSEGRPTTSVEIQPPVRLCCGLRHHGVVCPDGKIMCAICFGRFAPDDLMTDARGTWDICKECAPHAR